MKEPIILKIFGEVEVNTIIKKIEGKKLKQTEKNYLYRSIRPKLRAAEILSQAKILKEINKNKRKDTDIIDHNLAAYGYKMILPKKKIRARKIPLEDLIGEILSKNSSARYIEAIPILIIKNKLNKFKMLEVATKFDIKNKIGYLIETAMMIKEMPYLKELLVYFRENKDREIAFLAEGDYNFLMKTSPERIKKWRLLGRFFDADFIEDARLYK
ncbi:hypothetical protein HYT51_01840 [Candidatus Woesearchaeota archaeon]|nr:hypothetical protein [Candidatus Woesearchaeota archaeon]